MSKETWQEAAAQFRSLPPGVKAAIEKLTPARLSADDLKDIEGDWIVNEVLFAKKPEERGTPIDRAHTIIRKLLCHLAAQ